MMKILENVKREALSKRGTSFWFVVASLVCLVVTLIAYLTMGENSYAPVLSGKVIALLFVCLTLAALFSVFEIKLGKYVLYLFIFWMWLEYVITQIMLIQNLLGPLVGNFDPVNTAAVPGFVLCIVFGALSWIAALTSAIIQKKEIGSSKAEREV